MDTQTVQWFSRCLGIARIGPFDSQPEATQAVMTTEGLPATGAFVWPEPVKPRSRKRS